MKNEKKSSIWRKLKYYRNLTGKVEIFEGFLINQFGEVKNLKTNHIYSVQGTKTKGTYPKVIISVGSNRVHLSISVALCSSFKKCPTGIGYDVDHIDRDRKNFSLNNLRFISKSKNQSNKNKFSNIKILIGWKDDFKIMEIINLDLLTREERHRLTSRLRYHHLKNQSYKNLNWCLIQGNTYERIKKEKISIKSIINSDWIKCKECKLVTYYISNLGLIKSAWNSGINCYSFGTPSYEDGKIRYYISMDNNTYIVSRLVAQYFLNEGKILDENLVVDHIDTNSENNNAVNLKICSQKDNMDNPITKESILKARKIQFYGADE